MWYLRNNLRIPIRSELILSHWQRSDSKNISLTPFCLTNPVPVCLTSGFCASTDKSKHLSSYSLIHSLSYFSTFFHWCDQKCYKIIVLDENAILAPQL